MTPALFQRTSSFPSFARNSSADFLMVAKSLRSKLRKTSSPLEAGKAALMPAIVAVAFSSDRAAT